MNKKYIIKDKTYFNMIIQNGAKLCNKYYVVCYLPAKLSYPRFGFAVGKKCGNAVNRNKIRRKLKNIVRDNENLFINYDYVIIAKSFCKLQKYDKLMISMQDLMIKLS